MKEAILKYVEEHPHTSFAELTQSIPNFSGEYGLFQPDFPNVVVWPSLSEQAVQALVDLLRSQQIVFTPASILTYHIDGLRPSLPIATGPKHYKSPRWLPVCICTPTQRDADAKKSKVKGKTKMRTKR